MVFRPSREPVALRRAAESLLSKTANEVDDLVQAAVASAARSIAATLTVEAINGDGLDYGANVASALQAPFYDLGLELTSLLVEDISDELGYLDALGKAHAAEMIRDAIVKEANARRDAAKRAAGGHGPEG